MTVADVSSPAGVGAPEDWAAGALDIQAVLETGAN